MHEKIIKCASSRVAHIHAKIELSMLEGIYCIRFGIKQVDIIFYRNEYNNKWNDVIITNSWSWEHFRNF